MTVHLVDQHLVAPGSVAALVRLVHDVGVPMMEAAGASFVSCERAPELGDDVDVLSVWSCADFVEWNRIRRNLMFDPRYHAYSAELAGAPARWDPALLRRGSVDRVAAEHGLS